jgi:hypothetical protein
MLKGNFYHRSPKPDWQSEDSRSSAASACRADLSRRSLSLAKMEALRRRMVNQKSAVKRDGTVFFPPLPAKIPSINFKQCHSTLSFRLSTGSCRSSAASACRADSSRQSSKERRRKLWRKRMAEIKRAFFPRTNPIYNSS